MILSFLRDKLLSFVLPVLLVAGILGTFVWVVGKVYFWDTARIKLILPTETANIKITVQVPLVHKDIHFFGLFSYPIHFILPWSRNQACHTPCILDRLPAGDAMVIVTNTSETTQFHTLILPDTDGTIDIRPEFTFMPLADIKEIQKLQSPAPSKKEFDLLPSIRYENTVQGVYLCDQFGDRKLYDTLTKQLLPITIEADMAGRTEDDGVYFLYAHDTGMSLFDRYGRKPLTNLANFEMDGYTWSWDTQSTYISKNDKHQILDGIWWPFKNHFVTNGKEILLIQEKGV